MEGPQVTGGRKKYAHSQPYIKDGTDPFHLVFYDAQPCQVKSGNEVAPTAENQMLYS